MNKSIPSYTDWIQTTLLIQTENMTLEIQQWTSQQKTHLKICWQKELLLLSLYDSRILLLYIYIFTYTNQSIFYVGNFIDVHVCICLFYYAYVCIYVYLCVCVLCNVICYLKIWIDAVT